MGKFYRFLLLLGACVGPLSLAQNCALEQLVEIALVKVEEERTHEENAILQHFRQTPHTQPRLVDLDSANSWKPSAPVTAALPEKWTSPLPGLPSQYEEWTLQLRRGDTVQFGDRAFQLGKYLGMGYNTQVFSLAEDPTRAIRIPLIHLRSRNPYRIRWTGGDPQENRKLNQRLFHQAWLERAKSRQAGLVKIVEIDLEGRFILVQRVNSNKNGRDYLTPYISRTTPGFLEYPKDFRIPPDEKDKVEALLLLMVRNDQAWIQYNPTGTIVLETALRQYSWDETERRWFLLDPF